MTQPGSAFSSGAEQVAGQKRKTPTPSSDEISLPDSATPVKKKSKVTEAAVQDTQSKEPGSPYTIQYYTILY